MDRREARSRLMDLGFYVPVPINMQILLTSSELAVFNTVWHNEGDQISMSLFSLYTKLTHKTINAALKNLKAMRLLNYEGGRNMHIINYQINYVELIRIVELLNATKNIVERHRVAGQYRMHSGLAAINENIIKLYNGSKFDQNF